MKKLSLLLASVLALAILSYGLPWLPHSAVSDSYINPQNSEGKSISIKCVDLGDGTYAYAVSPATGTTNSTKSWVNRSSTITLGGTAQTLASANTTRCRLVIINPNDATESLWINFTTTAAAASPSIELQPGGSWTEMGPTCTGELISVYAASTGHAFTAKEASN